MTNVGPVLLTVSRTSGETECFTAGFESPAAGAGVLAGEHRDRLLATLGWARADLDPRFPPMVATAGNRHPVLVARQLARLADLDYDFSALATM